MRKLALLLLLAAIALPAMAAKRVTVEQLEQVLAAAHGKQDGKVAQQLINLELTERLSGARLARWEAALPGAESRRALVVLADMSAFLEPPAAEIPAAATPDVASQRKIMAMAVDYAVKTIRNLPNFIATQDTIHFEDTPSVQRADASITLYAPLHAVGRYTSTILYRDGREVVDSGTKKDRKQGSAAPSLATSGVFGPILGTVLVDAGQGKIVWSHWEQGAAGPVAVFSFAVPTKESHYQVEFCCVPGNFSDGVFQEFSGYHGEIAVDPVSGAILRLTLKADLRPSAPLATSDILVEYGPVEIGGTTYVCPVKSISVTRAPPAAPTLQNYRGSLLDNNGSTGWSAEGKNRERLQTLLNDVVFEQYHVFRAEARVLTGDNAGATGTAAAPVAASGGVAETPAAQEETTARVEAPAAVATAESSASVTTAAAVPAAPAVAAASAPAADVPAPELATPEISVAETAALPDAAAAQSAGAQGKGFTLRVTTRLVDVDVVALDKKGRPVTDLKPDDFEIYDNGRKQAVRFFSQAGGAPAAQTPQAQTTSSTDQEVFSNRRGEIAEAKPGGGTTEGSTTILLLDARSLGWADLTYARDQMLKFLEKLPASELVGLYAQGARGFQVLMEGTADHTALATTLRQWMPSAQNLAAAQEAEQHNRQQFDEVLHPGDLQYVNGTTNTPAFTGTMIDPQLRDFGRNPGRDALVILVGVARHLAAIPGHKNLVWVASDNVLADWQDKAAGTDKDSKQIASFVLRAQDALNDAHVSVYPLDASQLETMATDASLANASVALSPSVTAPPPHQGGFSGAGLGRTAAEMQQDIHPIQGAIQGLAQATGGQVFRRSGSIAASLNTVVEDGRAAYLLGFSPDTPADDQYHVLTVKLNGQHGVTVRYRAGYFYAKEAAAMKDRFREAIWQPLDMNEIAVSARPEAAYTGAILKLNIAINDVALQLEGGRWKDKLDIFVVHRGVDDLRARITGRTMVLALLPATYQSLLEKGIPFNQFVERGEDSGSVRIVVVDENSGRMGSVTFPAAILQGKL
ncbi:MAG: VWA domain-containing protein [Acidobacteriota bacterium]|nr:VWA domain-containing protein [Acidobacteriota bacterium]